MIQFFQTQPRSPHHREDAQQKTLQKRLAARISHDGAISVADYMAACLYDPDHGYYRRAQAIGRTGDFITAPEISQIFGELVGLWCAAVWQQLGEPATIRLVELGPGRGTLMADMLRSFRGVPGLRDAVRIELIEVSETLRDIQAGRLANLAANEVASLTWSQAFAADMVPTIIVANEFLDALPLRQFVKADDGWRERLVDADADGALRFRTADSVAELSAFGLAAPPAETGAVLELRDWRGEHAALIAAMAEQARNGPFAALFIDYGHAETAVGDTLQAVRAHTHADVLSEPGLADLSAHVDFGHFLSVCTQSGIRSFPLSGQGEFLAALGGFQRVQRLVASAAARQANEIETAFARLVHPAAMGARFKVAALASPELTSLPGLPGKQAM